MLRGTVSLLLARGNSKGAPEICLAWVNATAGSCRWKAEAGGVVQCCDLCLCVPCRSRSKHVSIKPIGRFFSNKAIFGPLAVDMSTIVDKPTVRLLGAFMLVESKAPILQRACVQRPDDGLHRLHFGQGYAHNESTQTC